MEQQGKDPGDNVNREQPEQASGGQPDSGRGQQIYRKESLERISAPDDLSQYLHVTRPSVWFIMGAVILLLCGTLVWANFMSVKSRVLGQARVENKIAAVTFDDQTRAGRIEVGMPAKVGNLETEIDSVGRDAAGRVICACQTDLPDGTYSFEATYKVTKIISFLFG